MPNNASNIYLEVLLPSSWLNTMLYMLEIVLVFRYFSRFPGGSRYFHVLVCVMLLADTVGTAAVCSNAWLNLITRRDDKLLSTASTMLTKSLADPNQHDVWTLSVILIATSIAALCEQAFLIYRFFTLSNAKKTSIFLVMLVGAHASLMGYTAIQICIQPTRTSSSPATRAFMVGSCLSALVDLMVPVVLYCQLRKITSSIKSTPGLVLRVSIQALSSGAVVAVLGFVCAILFWMMRVEFVIIFACLGRIYTITVLFNLLRRKVKNSSISIGQPARFRAKVSRVESFYVNRSTSIDLDEYRSSASGKGISSFLQLGSPGRNSSLPDVDLPKA